MLNKLQLPTLEARGRGGGGWNSQSTFFYKIHCGTMSVDKDNYLAPSQRTRSTRSSHKSQYCRPKTYSDALQYSFSPRTISHWNSLSSTVVAAETTEEFRTLHLFKCSVRRFYFYTHTHTHTHTHARTHARTHEKTIETPLQTNVR